MELRWEKLVSIYAHIDLDLDETAGLNLNGSSVVKGQLVSKNLYSGTTGGPHLHFEIRYYRPNDNPSTDFYGGIGTDSSFISKSTDPGNMDIGIQIWVMVLVIQRKSFNPVIHI